MFSQFHSSRFLRVVACLSVAALAALAGAETAPTTPAAEKSNKSNTEILVDRCRVILDKEAILASDRVGILAEILPAEGDRVAVGEKVAGLKDDVAVTKLAVAEKEATNDVEIRYAAKAAEVAEAEHRRAVEANQQLPGTLSQTEVERLRLSAERALLQIEKAELDHEVAGLNRDQAAAELSTFEVTSPIDGTVVQVMKSEGEAVNQGDPILHVVNTDAMRVEGFVTVADAFSIKAGDAVTVRLDLPYLSPNLREKVFEGQVEFVDVIVNNVTLQVRVWAKVQNDDKLLRAGLPAVMTIHAGKNMANQAGK